MKTILLLISALLCSCAEKKDNKKMEEELLAQLNKKHSKMSVLYWIVSEEKIKAVEEQLLLKDADTISNLLSLINVKSSTAMTIGVSGDILIDGSNSMSFVFPDKIHAQIGENKKTVYALELVDDSFYRELSAYCLEDSLDKGYLTKKCNIILWIGGIRKEIEKANREKEH